MRMVGIENGVFGWNKGPLREGVGHKVGEGQEQPREKSEYQPWKLRISFPLLEMESYPNFVKTVW